jgi:two-component system, response regulator YesN
MPYTLLLVDDDRDFRQEFRDHFDEYVVLEAASGEAALQLLRKPNEVDLVLLDVRLPGQRGTQVLQTIRRMDPNLGIIILTGYSSKDVAVEALQGHADDYLEKPLRLDRVKATIERVLASHGTDPPLETSDPAAKVEKAKRFAERNWNLKISLHDAAEAVHLSPKYLSRLFKQMAGTGFSAYRLRIKLRKARELMEKGQNVSQVALSLGYENSESFIRIFKKYEGTTPRRARARIKAVPAGPLNRRRAQTAVPPH